MGLNTGSNNSFQICKQDGLQVVTIEKTTHYFDYVIMSSLLCCLHIQLLKVANDETKFTLLLLESIALKFYHCINGIN